MVSYPRPSFPPWVTTSIKAQQSKASWTDGHPFHNRKVSSLTRNCPEIPKSVVTPIKKICHPTMWSLYEWWNGTWWIITRIQNISGVSTAKCDRVLSLLYISLSCPSPPPPDPRRLSLSTRTHLQIAQLGPFLISMWSCHHSWIITQPAIPFRGSLSCVVAESAAHLPAHTVQFRQFDPLMTDWQWGGDPKTRVTGQSSTSDHVCVVWYVDKQCVR